MLVVHAGGEVEAESLWGRSMTDILNQAVFSSGARAGQCTSGPGSRCLPVAGVTALNHQAALGVGGYLRPGLSRPSPGSQS